MFSGGRLRIAGNAFRPSPAISKRIKTVLIKNTCICENDCFASAKPQKRNWPQNGPSLQIGFKAPNSCEKILSENPSSRHRLAQTAWGLPKTSTRVAVIQTKSHAKNGQTMPSETTCGKRCQANKCLRLLCLSDRLLQRVAYISNYE